MKFLNVCFSCFLILLVTFKIYGQSEITEKNGRLIFPRPFAFAIDDLGWNIGNNEGYNGINGPYRIGLNRKMGLKDYECIVAIADSLNIRIQGLFILSEFDKENILKDYPSTTKMGKNWDNIYINSNEVDSIMAYVKENAAFLEFGLHGVGHEFWLESGQRRRAEWYNTDDNEPWPQQEIASHIEAFKLIMGQYGISPEKGHSFPESFVPCAYSYHWNPDGNYSTGTMLNPEGVKFTNTLFAEVIELNPPIEPNGGGIDHGVLVVNRINYGNPWYELSSVPTIPVEQQQSDMIESHWSNWLAQDDFLQDTTNRLWINYYRMVQQVPDRFIAKNTEQFYSQWLYKKFTVMEEKEPGKMTIDNHKMPKEVYEHKLLSTVVLKVPLEIDEHVSRAELDGIPMVSYYEEAGFGFIELPMLNPKVYELTYSVDSQCPETYIHHNDSYIVYSTEKKKSLFSFKVRIYGTQNIEIIGVDKPEKIASEEKDIQLISFKYEPVKRRLNIVLRGVDMQGETGIINVITK